MTLPTETGVFICGAGPTGLSLAVRLAQLRVPFVLVDRLAEPLATSRAAAVHARTLEVLELLGIADVMVAAGRQLPQTVMYGHSNSGPGRRQAADPDSEKSVRPGNEKPPNLVSDEAARTRIGQAAREASGQGDVRDETLLRLDFSTLRTRYPYILALPQDRTEAILTQRLDELGGTIQRGCEVQDVRATTVVVRNASGEVVPVRAEYVVGADGYHSAVREAARIAFNAGTYPQTFVLADIHMDWPLSPDEMALFLAPAGLLLVVPFSDDRYRLVGTQDEAPEHPQLADVRSLLDERGPPGARARDIVWSSRFRIHHGVAARYRADRVFLAGDAAHVHSPAGGQGMNTGIQDAVFLADTLASVIKDGQPDTILDRYEAERRPVALRVVRMTDRMTRMGTPSNAAAQRLRNVVLGAAGYLPPLQRRIATRIAELRN